MGSSAEAEPKRKHVGPTIGTSARTDELAARRRGGRTRGHGPPPRTLLQLKARVAHESKARTAKSQSMWKTAERATSGSASGLPFSDRIQRSFGKHDVSGIAAFIGGNTDRELDSMNADGFARGNTVALRTGASLHTVAHEAAHVVQQRGGVSLSEGVGRGGDTHERAADQVADLVVAGRCAEALLDSYGAPSSKSGSASIQKKDKPGANAADSAGHDQNAARAVTRAAVDILTHGLPRLIKSAPPDYRFALSQLYMAVAGTDKGKPIDPALREQMFRYGLSIVRPMVESEASGSESDQASLFDRKVAQRRAEIEYSSQSQRVDQAVEVGKAVFDPSAPVDDATWSTQRVEVLAEVQSQLGAVTKVSRLLNAELADGATELAPAISRLQIAHRSLVALRKLLTLTNSEARKKMNAPQLALLSAETIGASVLAVSQAAAVAPALFGGGAGAARLAQLAQSATGRTLGRVLVVAMMVRNVITVFTAKTLEEKGRAGAEVVAGAALLAGSVPLIAAASSVFLTVAIGDWLAQQYHATRRNLAMSAIKGIRELGRLGARVNAARSALAKAVALHAQEKEPHKRAALADVVKNRAFQCSQRIRDLLSAVRPVSYSRGAHSQPGAYFPIVERFAGVQGFDHGTDPTKILNHAKHILFGVQWCFDNAAAIVDRIARESPDAMRRRKAETNRRREAK